MKLSTIILTKNEEKNIDECIKSVRQVVDEIIVIDDNSADKTTEIAEKSGAKVYIHSLNDNFASQRNFGLEKAKGEWILFLDADERVSESLRSEVTKLLSNSSTEFDGYFIPRIDIIWGKELRHGETGSAKILRLGRKNSGIWKRRVHEYWKINGKIGTLKNPILHYPHQTLREFIDEINFYSTLHARANFEEGKRSNIFKIIFFAKLKFIDNFIVKLGFLDGTRGFVHAMLMSFHSFLAWSKLWLLQRK